MCIYASTYLCIDVFSLLTEIVMLIWFFYDTLRDQRGYDQINAPQYHFFCQEKQRNGNLQPGTEYLDEKADSSAIKATLFISISFVLDYF